MQASRQWTAGVLAVFSFALGCIALSQDRDSSGVPKTSTAAPPADQRVDINHATLQQLLKAPGMTPSWAGRIIRYRPYRTKQDLFDKGIVSSAVYDRIKDFVIAHRDQH